MQTGAARDGAYIYTTSYWKHEVTMKETPLLLTERQVCAMAGIGRTALYYLRRSGKFPKPVDALGTRATRWRRADVEAWVASLCEK